MNVLAYGKINLGLSILYKRSDLYHELESIMVSVDLADEIEFIPTTNRSITIECNLKFINYKTNLIYIIAKDLQEQYKIQTGLLIKLYKNIPLSGGMAGGSTDAAATIKVLNELWELNLSKDEMFTLGAKYGADIPFCINQTPAFVGGIGEKVEPFQFEPDFKVIIVEMPFGLSTKKIFDNIEFTKFPIYNISSIKDALINKNRDKLIQNLGNNMEEVSLILKPQIKQVKDLLIDLGCFTSIMSGSGPTVLGLIDLEVNADNIIKTFEKLGYKAYCCKIIT